MVGKGNGQYITDDFGRVYVEYDYSKGKENNEVDSDMKIRHWDSEEWIEPTADIYERDCKGVTK